MRKETIHYLLKHESGFYVKTASGFIELTEDKERAKRFDPMATEKSDDWNKLYSTGKYIVEKRTEVIAVKYEEVDLSDV